MIILKKHWDLWDFISWSLDMKLLRVFARLNEFESKSEYGYQDRIAREFGLYQDDMMLPPMDGGGVFFIHEEFR